MLSSIAQSEHFPEYFLYIMQTNVLFSHPPIIETKTDWSQYNDPIMPFFFSQNSVGWQFELGRFTSAPNGGGWNHTYGCSHLTSQLELAAPRCPIDWLIGWLMRQDQLDRCLRTQQANLGSFRRWSGSAKYSSCDYKAQYVWVSNLSVCYWPNLATWPKIKLTMRGLLQDTGFAKAWSTQFAINPLQSLLT